MIFSLNDLLRWGEVICTLVGLLYVLVTSAGNFLASVVKPEPGTRLAWVSEKLLALGTNMRTLLGIVQTAEEEVKTIARKAPLPPISQSLQPVVITDQNNTVIDAKLADIVDDGKTPDLRVVTPVGVEPPVKAPPRV